MKNRLLHILLGTALGFVAINANAHTSSMGFLPGDVVGDVVFWTGTYVHGTCPASNEGSMTLTGANGTVYGPTTLAFDIPSVCTKPVGLVDGDNNCFWNTVDGGSSYQLDCSLTSAPSWLTGIGGVIMWQAVVFTGLQAGDYTFTCGDTCGTTATWQSLPGASGEVPLTLGEDTVGGSGPAIPVPTLSTGSILVLLILFAMLGMVFVRTRQH
jgi:hypothetical protein